MKNSVTWHILIMKTSTNDNLSSKKETVFKQWQQQLIFAVTAINTQEIHIFGYLKNSGS